MRFRTRPSPVSVVAAPPATTAINPLSFRQRVRQPSVPALQETVSIIPTAFRYRVRQRSVPLLPPAPVLTASGRPPKRRGRAPSYIPDPWSDLEWDAHPDAKRVVSENPAGMTLEQIGEVMNITRERVRQIEKSALAKLLTDGGNDITWIGKLTLAIPTCRRCDEPYVRTIGRQMFCPVCDATRKKKRHIMAA